MLKASVSNLELYRVWREEEDLELGWFLERVLGRVEQTPQQRIGEALHRALEMAEPGEAETLETGDYRFLFDADCQISFTPLREVNISGQYGDLLVSGRVDAIVGLTVVDYKSGDRMDADRLLNSFQWRFYLDLLGLASFEWRWFALRETDEPRVYRITGYERLSENWYPDLHDDCEKLAREYLEFARGIPALNRMVA